MSDSLIPLKCKFGVIFIFDILYNDSFSCIEQLNCVIFNVFIDTERNYFLM